MALKKHRLTFAMTERGPDFRIVVGTLQRPRSPRMAVSTSGWIVLGGSGVIFQTPKRAFARVKRA